MVESLSGTQVYARTWSWTHMEKADNANGFTEHFAGLIACAGAQDNGNSVCRTPRRLYRLILLVDADAEGEAHGRAMNEIIVHLWRHRAPPSHIERVVACVAIPSLLVPSATLHLPIAIANHRNRCHHTIRRCHSDNTINSLSDYICCSRICPTFVVTRTNARKSTPIRSQDVMFSECGVFSSLIEATNQVAFAAKGTWFICIEKLNWVKWKIEVAFWTRSHRLVWPRSELVCYANSHCEWVKDARERNNSPKLVKSSYNMHCVVDGSARLSCIANESQ